MLPTAWPLSPRLPPALLRRATLQPAPQGLMHPTAWPLSPTQLSAALQQRCRSWKLQSTHLRLASFPLEMTHISQEPAHLPKPETQCASSLAALCSSWHAPWASRFCSPCPLPEWHDDILLQPSKRDPGLAADQFPS